MARERFLVETLVELADNLVDDFDVIELLTALSHRCCEALDVDAAGVMLGTPSGELQFVASSNESMRILELFQIQAEQGPCVDCFRTSTPVECKQLAESVERWPLFTPRALSHGFQSVNSLPMKLRGRTIGALNLFRTHEGSMNDDDTYIAQGFAHVATIAILQHRTAHDASVLNTQLGHALNSRIIIEQAKGMIAQTLTCGMDHAFGIMRTYSRNHNLGLTLVATLIVNLELPIETISATTKS